MTVLDNITVTDIIEVTTVASKKGRSYTMTNRKSYGLAFCIDGQITYTQNGRKYVSDPNHAVILPEDGSYTLNGDKAGHFPLINFTCTEPICSEITIIPIKSIEVYLKIFEQIKLLSLLNGSRAKQMSFLYDIFHRLSSGMEPLYNILSPSIRFLEENFSSQSLTVTDLAKQCGISEVYYRKLFVGKYKVTPKQYIIDLRIAKSKQMLSDGIMKISAVAEECGFSNPYHFSRVFKEKVGITPSEYMYENRIFKI